MALGDSNEEKTGNMFRDKITSEYNSVLKTNFLQMELCNLFASKMALGETRSKEKASLNRGRCKSRNSKGQPPSQ